MIYKSKEDILGEGVISYVDGKVEVKDLELFREKMVHNLVDTIILSDSPSLKKFCYFVTYQVAINCNIIPSSIQELYEEKARENFPPFTVPAINLRTLTFDLARAIFRAGERLNGGAFIFEIAKSEIGYTDQSPQEYVSCVLLAAIKENFRGPVFIQGDHFQVKAKNFFSNRDEEIKQIKDLIRKAVAAGFYNIDVDTSTLVDLSKPTYEEQQELNVQVCAALTKFIREIQPQGIDISIGGEIGEIGGKNSTPQELHAFMKSYSKEVGHLKKISKIAVQTGTRHGGVVLPNGTIAKVKIDFDTLKELSSLARKEYGLAGCVQHGASTLPNEAFHRFPEVGCCEIHLATQFQNIVYNYLPLPLKEEIYRWLHQNCGDERKPEHTDDQFIYSTRKKALGPFKKKIYSLPHDLKDKISLILEKEFTFLFEELNIKDTKEIVNKYVHPVIIEKKEEDFFKQDEELGDLSGAD